MKKQIHVVVIDHYDSFTYNLVVYLERLGASVQVFRTNSDLREVEMARPTHLVLSPGPGHPKEVTLFLNAIKCFEGRIPLLGVCLGHQAIAYGSGASVEQSGAIMHGKTSKITHDGLGIFEGIPHNPLQVCRYHSLAIVGESIPSGSLRQTAWSEDGTIMGIESVKYPNMVGAQFHPESLFTDCGLQILGNFLSLKGQRDEIPSPLPETRAPGFGSAPTRSRPAGRGWG